MEIKMSVDRIATNVAICYGDNDEKYEIPVKLSSFEIGDIISVTFDGDAPVCVTVLKEETAQKKAELAKRTKNLFSRNKNN